MIKRLLTAALTVIMLGGATAMAGSAPRKTRAGGASSAVTTVCTGPNGEWIKRGKSGIIVARDSAGVVRAMSPAAGSEAMGRKYADALKVYEQIEKEYPQEAQAYAQKSSQAGPDGVFTVDAYIAREKARLGK